MTTFPRRPLLSGPKSVRLIQVCLYFILCCYHMFASQQFLLVAGLSLVSNTTLANSRQWSYFFCFVLASITKATVKWLSKYDHVDLNSLSKIEGRVLRDIRQNCNSFEELGHNTFLKFICSEENLLELLQSSMNVGRVTSSNIPTKKEMQSFMLQCGNAASEVNFFWHFIL